MKYFGLTLAMTVVVAVSAIAQCNCTSDKFEPIRFTSPRREVSIMCCVEKTSALGSQTVNWCVGNNTSDTLQVTFSKNYTLTCGGINSTQADFILYAGEKKMGNNFSGEISLWDMFDNSKCNRTQRIANVGYTDLVIENLSDKRRQRQADRAADARKAQQETQNDLRQRQQEEAALQEQSRRQGIEDQRQREIESLIAAAERKDEQRSQQYQQMSDAIGQFGDYLVQQEKRKEIQRMEREKDEAFERLKSQVRSGTGTFEDCAACGGGGMNQCSSCNGAGTEVCSSCGGAGTKSCGTCFGTGSHGTLTCYACKGSRVEKCVHCSGRGQSSCSRCWGIGNSNCYSCQGTGKTLKYSSQNTYPSNPTSNSYSGSNTSVAVSSSVGLGPARRATGSGVDLLVDEFNDNRNGWAVGKFQELEAAVVGGVYQVSETSKGSRLIWQLRGVPAANADYEVEVFVRHRIGYNEDLFGVMFGVNNQNLAHRALVLDGNGNFQVKGRNEQGYLYQAIRPTGNYAIKGMNEVNILRIRKTAYNYSFYINDVKVGDIVVETPYGSGFGLYIETRTLCTVEYDNFRVTQYPPTPTTDRSVSGRVVDEEGRPIPGTNVVHKGTTNGTVTNDNGNFRLLVTNPGNAILEFSMIGYKTGSVLVGDSSEVSITLIEDVKRRKKR